MQTMHTSSRSVTSSPASSRRWTIRTAIGQSGRGARGAAAVAAALALGSTLDSGIPATTGIVLACLLPAVLVDVIDRRLPDRLVTGAASIGVAALIVEVLLADLAIAPEDLALGAAALAGPPLVIHLIAPGAMGFGDVKVALVAGAALGLTDPVLGLGALAIGSAGAAVVGLARGRRTVAFGPGLVGGAIVALILLASPLDPFEPSAPQSDNSAAVQPRGDAR